MGHHQQILQQDSDNRLQAWALGQQLRRALASASQQEEALELVSEGLRQVLARASQDLVALQTSVVAAHRRLAPSRHRDSLPQDSSRLQEPGEASVALRMASQADKRMWRCVRRKNVSGRPAEVKT